MAAGKGGVALQDRHHSVGEEAHVELGLLMRHRAEREFGDQVVEPGQALQFADLLQAIIGRPDDLDADVEIGRLGLRLGAVVDLGVGLGHLAVALVAFDGRQMTIGETVVVVDRLPLLAEILDRALLRLGAAVGDADIGQDDRRTRGVPGRGGDLPVMGDVGRGLGPFVLHDHQDAEAELGHDLGRVGADRRGVEAALGMRDRPRPDRGARDLEELALMLEAVLRQRLDDDLRRLDKARSRLFHRDAEALVFDARGAAPEAEQTTPAAQDV